MGLPDGRRPAVPVRRRARLCSYFALPWNCDDCLPVYLLGLGAWSLVWAVCLIVAHYVSLSRLAHMEATPIEPDESFVRFFAVFVLFPLFAGELVNGLVFFFGAFATYSSEVSCGRGPYRSRPRVFRSGSSRSPPCFLPTRATRRVEDVLALSAAAAARQAPFRRRLLLLDALAPLALRGRRRVFLLVLVLVVVPVEVRARPRPRRRGSAARGGGGGALSAAAASARGAHGSDARHDEGAARLRILRQARGAARLQDLRNPRMAVGGGGVRGARRPWRRRRGDTRRRPRAPRRIPADRPTPRATGPSRPAVVAPRAARAAGVRARRAAARRGRGRGRRRVLAVGGRRRRRRRRAAAAAARRISRSTAASPQNAAARRRRAVGVGEIEARARRDERLDDLHAARRRGRAERRDALAVRAVERRRGRARAGEEAAHGATSAAWCTTESAVSPAALGVARSAPASRSRRQQPAWPREANREQRRVARAVGRVHARAARDQRSRTSSCP